MRKPRCKALIDRSETAVPCRRNRLGVFPPRASPQPHLHCFSVQSLPTPFAYSQIINLIRKRARPRTFYRSSARQHSSGRRSKTSCSPFSSAAGYAPTRKAQRPLLPYSRPAAAQTASGANVFSDGETSHSTKAAPVLLCARSGRSRCLRRVTGFAPERGRLPTYPAGREFKRGRRST